MHRILQLLLIGSLSLPFASPATAAIRTDLRRIAVLGDQAPVSNGDEVFFQNLFSPRINNHGDVAFQAIVQNAAGELVNDRGIWVSGSSESTERVRSGQFAPGSPPGEHALFTSFSNLLFNDSGQVGYLARTNDADQASGYWISDSTATIPIAVRGAEAISPDWQYTGFFYLPSLNDHGQMAFNLSVEDSVNATELSGIFINDHFSTNPIALQGMIAGEGPGLFANTIRNEPPLNHLGQTAFHTGVVDPDLGAATSSAVFLGTAGSLAVVAETGTLAPGTNTTFQSFSSLIMPINSSGDSVFRANLENASPGNNQGLWRTRNGAAELLVRKGDVAIPATESSAEAIFQVFPSNSIVPGILIDDSDQVVFAAELAGDDITPQLNSFTVWSSRDGELNLLYQRGMSAPGTHDNFSTLGIHFATNAVGQLVLRGRAGTKDGIWAQDPSG